MRVLITGGAGFIGSHVVDGFLSQGDSVAVIDNLSSGRRENLHPSARLYELSICDPAIDDVLARERPQIVSHHAAQISVPYSMKHPEDDIRDNLVGLVRVASSCVRHGVETLVFASTAAVYGHPDGSPVPETAQARPMSPYGIDKLAGEYYLRYFEAIQGLKVRILRYANVYGPRQNPHGEAGVVAIFANTMLRGERPHVFGDGTQQRDFVYVGDVARACLAAPNAPDCEPINVCTGSLTSLNELYRLIAEAAGFDQPAVCDPPRPGEVHSISLDPTRARERMGWVPQTSLPQGLRLTIESIRGER